MVQHPFFNIEEILDRPLKKYELFFSVIDLYSLSKDQKVSKKLIKRSAIAKALIFKNLRSVDNLSDLSAELYDRYTLASLLGFEPKDKLILVERFCRFLKDTDNKILQGIGISLLKSLSNSG